MLVGYIVSIDPSFDVAAARTALEQTLPAALVPRLVLVEQLPARMSGKVNQDALPWPVGEMANESPNLGDTMGWLAGPWRQVLGAAIDGPDADFFAVGGESLSAAQLVEALRHRYPQMTIAELHDHPRLSSLARFIDEFDPPVRVAPHAVRPTPVVDTGRAGAAVATAADPDGMQWGEVAGAGNTVAGPLRLLSWPVTVDGWWIIAGFLLFITPAGRIAIAVFGARLLLSRLQQGTYRRGGSEHLRVAAAESAAVPRRDLPADPVDGDDCHRRRRRGRIALAGKRIRLRLGCSGQRCRAAGGRRDRRRCHDTGEMVVGRPHPGDRAAAVVVVRVAQRGV